MLRFVGRLLVVPVALAILNIFIHVNALVSVGLIVGTLLFSIWAFRGRNRWGDGLEISSDLIRVLDGEQVRSEIPVRAIVAKSVRADSFLLSWNDADGKRKALIVGREAFLAATWSELSRALTDDTSSFVHAK